MLHLCLDDFIHIRVRDNGSSITCLECTVPGASIVFWWYSEHISSCYSEFISYPFGVYPERYWSHILCTQYG